MNDLNLALVLRLVNKVTAPARAAIRQVEEIGAASERAGRRGVAWSDRQISRVDRHRDALRGAALETAGLAFSFYQAMRPAIEFESAMAGVSKVIDFKQENGIARLGDDILKLTSEGGLPMAAEGIAEIIEAAGQAGIVDAALPDDEKRRQLIAFAEDAAKMGVAFDISANEAGAAMAQWRAAMGLTQERSLSLGDAINHLSNNMNAGAPALVDVIRRQGALAMQAGLAETEVAALAAAFLSGGASPEVAATALKNFTNALTKGESMTKRQRAVIKSLGMDATELSKRMQVDAKGAIIDVMEALAELPEHTRSAALGNLFGEESKGAVAPLLANLDNLRAAFDLVADPVNYAGAMLEEYEKQSATTANQLSVTRGYMYALAVTVGSILLPELNELLETIQPVIAAFADWAGKNPEWISLIVKLVAGFVALKAAMILVGWPLLTLARGGLWAFRAFSWLLVGGGKLLALFPRIARAVLFLVGWPLRLLGAALIGIGRLAMANPIGLLITAVAALAYVIYDNWDGIVEYFKDKIDRIYQAFDEGILQGVVTLLREFSPVTIFKDALLGLVEYLTGYRLDFEWVDLLPEWDWNAIIPDLTFGVNADVQAAQADYVRQSGAGNRALGGSVFAGRLYQVNEEGVELFQPGVTGRIVPADRLGGDARPSTRVDVGEIHVHAAPGMNARDVALEVRRELQAMAERPNVSLHDGGGFD